MNNQKNLIGLEEAAIYTGYSKHTLYQLTARNLIPFHKRPGGNKLFFSVMELDHWILSGK